MFALVADLLEDHDLHLRDEEQASFAPRRSCGGITRRCDCCSPIYAGMRRAILPEALATWCELWRRLVAFEDALLSNLGPVSVRWPGGSLQGTALDPHDPFELHVSKMAAVAGGVDIGLADVQ